MKLLSLLLIALLLVGCETITSIRGIDTTKKLEIDERLLQPPTAFQSRKEPITSEFDLLVEYGELARAYSAAYNTLSSLQKLLTGSNLVLKVPAPQPTFSGTPSETKPTTEK